MQNDEPPYVSPSALSRSPPDSNHHASSSGSQPSAKLRDKLRKLATWRIDQSSIEFLKGPCEFRGGNATVLRGFVTSPSGGQDRTSQLNPSKAKGLHLPASGPTSSPRRKDVAVKKMNMSDDPERVLGLTLREAEFLVGLSHENIIKLEGSVEDLTKDVVWLVFPWGDNGTLKDFIASAEWEIPERISLINDVTRGVEYLHSQQPPIRHGDLKSVNILVNSEYRAIITDFGSARHLTKRTRQAEAKPLAPLSLEATFCSSTNTIDLTLTGDNYTLRWAAPEVLREEEACLGSDIWALGWVAYEAMTNSIPFENIPDFDRSCPRASVSKRV